MSAHPGGDRSGSASGAVDFRGRIRVEECYGILYCDSNEKQCIGTSRWQEGQLTYHKTERKVFLFGPKNKRLEEFFNTTLDPPPPKEGEGTPQQPPERDLESLMEKKPTLAVGQIFFLRKNRYEVRIERVKSIHHKAFEVASRIDREGDMIREKVQKILDNAPDILADVLPPKRPAQDRHRSASPPPRPLRATSK